MLLVAENPSASSATELLEIETPCGLIGLPELKRFEIAADRESWPFLHLRSIDSGETLQFVAIEPGQVIPEYEIELNDIDSALLGLTSAADAIVFNIATVHSLEPQHVTVNLIGPIVANRHTGAARQVIIANSEAYSPRHVLIDERETAAAATA